MAEGHRKGGLYKGGGGRRGGPWKKSPFGIQEREIHEPEERGGEPLTTPSALGFHWTSAPTLGLLRRMGEIPRKIVIGGTNLSLLDTEGDGGTTVHR